MNTKQLAKGEIARRAHNRSNPRDRIQVAPEAIVTKVDGVAIFNMSGAQLQALAGTKKRATATKVTATVAPKTDKRVIPMSDEQRAERDRLFAEHGGGKAYAEACVAAGIPVRASTLKRHGLA